MNERTSIIGGPNGVNPYLIVRMRHNVFFE